MTNNLTSIIIPMYNESSWILKTVIRCLDLPIQKEIIVVDNNSSDDSYGLVHDFIVKRKLQNEIVLTNEDKQGKANGVRKGLSIAHGEYIVFHDADLEYDPKYIVPMVGALEDSDIVIGCRTCRPYTISIPAFIANKLLLQMIRKKYTAGISDIFTAQRGFRRSVILSMPFTSGNFEMETELTIRALNEGFKMKEIDVTYTPRTREEGKKIGVRDFVSILYKFFSVSRQIEMAKKLCEANQPLV